MNWRAYFCVVLGSIATSLAILAVREGDDWLVSPLTAAAWFCLWGLLSAIRPRPSAKLLDEIANARRDLADMRARIR